MKTIFVILTSGFASRNVLQTDVFLELKKSGARLVFFVPPGTKEEFQKYVQPEKVIFEEYKRPGFLERKLGSFRSLNSFDQAATWKLNTTTIKIKRALQKKRNLVRYFFYRFAALFTANRFLSQLFGFLDWLIFPKKWLKAFFDKYQPNLLYSTDPLFFDELYFLEYAKKRRIRTIAQILSWDNITGRGYLPLIPDYIVVWNEIMKNQILKIYKIFPDRIFVSGIPQFDFYFRPGSLPSREEFFRQIGADVSKKLIVYTTGAPANFPNENMIVEDLVNSFVNNDRGFKCQFYIRLSPRDSIDRHLGLLDKPDVLFSVAGRKYEKFRDFWNPSLEDSVSLASSLKYADVVVCHSSTICIEAAIFNTPIVLVDVKQRTRHFYHFDHFVDIVKSGGIRTGKTINEVIMEIENYLKEPNRDTEGRNRIVAEQCQFTDGRSGKRIVSFLISNM